ncbi:MAG TPA: PLP-dependent aminotransferase family protein [Chitinispirillaceae bacterium]|nr:PLP-dependent aminotransferase family protein [Chitinispirillaceae bacterium]
MSNNSLLTKKHFHFSSRVNLIPRSGVREILKTADSNMISFGGGIPHESCVPSDVIRESFDSVMCRYGQKAFSYGQTEGEPQLREFIANVWLRRLGIVADASEILVVNGSQQALDLLGKIFLEKGVSVLVERPTYMAALQAMHVYEPCILEAALDSSGADPEQLERNLKMNQCRFFYTIPSFQNPSGVCYTHERRLSVVNMLNKYGTLLVEDDPYSHLYYENPPAPPITALGAENAVFMGTFSKTVAPGFRLGWMYAKPEIMHHLVTVKQAADLCTGRLGQLLLLETLLNLDLDKHLQKLRLFYSKQRDLFDFYLSRHLNGILQWRKPPGGMFFWASTKGVAASELLLSCVKKSVAFADGAAFHAGGEGKQFLRLNFTQVSEQNMDRGLAVIREQILQANPS